MKKIHLLCVLAATLLLSGGCAQQPQKMSYIGAENAKQAALENAGILSTEAQSLTADLSTRNGQDYYQVEFTAAGQNYQYSVDALTGVIIEAQTPTAGVSVPQAGPVIQDELSSVPADLAAAPAGNDPSAAPAGNGTAAGTQPLASGALAGGTEAALSLAEAQAKALAHAGLTAEQVTFTKGELDYENRRLVYEVEFYTSDYQEYDYEIDASTGDVVSYDYEAESYTPPSTGSTITAAEAKDAALAHVPGATASDIWEFETDYDDGRLEYEGKIIYNGMEYEFEIDGYSGAIRSWESEPAHR